MANIGKKLLTILSVIISLVSCSTKTTGEIVVDYEYFPPVGEEKDVAILILGGSDGGMPYNHHHTDLTVGCPVMLLGYFNTENTPKKLVEIPLEYIDKAIDIFTSMESVKDKKLVVLGTSKGGELGLLVASRNPKVNGVIAKVPASVITQAFIFSFKEKSDWSLGGKSIPFVSFRGVNWRDSNKTYAEIFNDTLNKADNIEEASIKVENINGPILLLSGVEDTAWPATRMCNDIVKRLDENSFPFKYEHIAYEDAGHSLSEYWYEGAGGSEEGNKKARLDSIKRILNYIDNL